jgi:hypothetical protein
MVERYPDLKEEVCGSIHSCEISFLPEGKLARWSIASCALALAYWPSVSKKKKKTKKKHKFFFKTLKKSHQTP